MTNQNKEESINQFINNAFVNAFEQICRGVEDDIKRSTDHSKKSSYDNLKDLTDYQKAMVCIISKDVKKAYETHDPHDIKEALESVKRIKKADGELDLDIMTTLKYELGMTFVWGKEQTATREEKRLALVYEGMAFQID